MVCLGRGKSDRKIRHVSSVHCRLSYYHKILIMCPLETTMFVMCVGCKQIDRQCMTHHERCRNWLRTTMQQTLMFKFLAHQSLHRCHLFKEGHLKGKVIPYQNVTFSPAIS